MMLKDLAISPDLLAIETPNLEYFISTFPHDLRQRYSTISLEFRSKLHERTRQLLLERRLHESSGVDEVSFALLSKNLLLPKRISDLNSAFDCIASVLATKRNGQLEATLIMENPSYGRANGLEYHEGGVGKTTLALAILDIPQPLNKLPPFQLNQMVELQNFSPILLDSPTKPPTFKVIALDLAYLGLHSGQLISTPIMGVEGLDGQSDIARSMARSKTKEVGVPYDRRRPDISRYGFVA